MAQTGYTPILIYASGTATNVPLAADLTSSASGAELALNYADGKLYYKNSSGVVTLLAAASGASGDVVGPASATDNALARFDLTTGKLIQNSVGILSDAGVLTGLTGLTSSGNITLSALTSGRVPYASTGGLLVDSANLLFDGTTLTANTLNTTGTANFASNVYLTTNATYYQSRTTGGTYVRMLGLNSGNTAYVGPIDAGPGDMILNASSSSVNIQFYASGSEQMRLTSTGLGIGTSSPANTLNVVKDNTAARGQLSLQTVTASNFAQITFYDQTTLSAQFYQGYGVDKAINIVNPLAHGIAFWTTNTERMRLDASGNLGLGVTPSAWGATYKVFELAGASNAHIVAYVNGLNVGTNYYINSGASYLYTYTGQNATRYSQTIGGQHQWFTAASGTAGDPITFTQAMTLDAAGELGIGVTNPQAKLDVYSDSTTAATPIAYFSKALNSNATSNVLVQFYINFGGTGSGQINANGASAAAFGTFSDARLKKNIVGLPSQLGNIMALRPVEFDYKDGSGHQIGFVAQEMQEVYPDVVAPGKDDMLMVTGWSKTEARLVKAIQELKAEVDSLKAQLKGA
jgi:hypothetical protein